MAPLHAMECVGIDEERKRDLVMEKRLRACRVNIIPRDRGYCLEADIPTPVRRQRTPPPSPAAIQRAKNPVALRYWNQCVEQSVPRVADDRGAEESLQRREHQVKEAVGNINRYVTVDKMKRDDTVRNSRPRFRHDKLEFDTDANFKSYNSIKEEQIKISQGRTNFQNISVNRIPSSPTPYRRGISETRVPRPEKNCACGPKDMNLNHMVNEIVPAMNENEKTKVCLAILDQLPSDTVCALLAQKLSALPTQRLESVMNSLPDKAVSTAVPALFPRTKDDVKLSLILASVPNLTKQLRK